MQRKTEDMKQPPHESTNVTVSCSHEGLVREHHENGEHSGEPQTLTFVEAMRGINLNPISEENAKDNTISETQKVEKLGNNHDSSEEDEEITRRLELHLQLVNSQSVDNNEKEKKHKGLNAKISDEVEISSKRRQSKRTGRNESSNKYNYRRHKSESPTKYHDLTIKTNLSESPKRTSVIETGNQDHYLRPRTTSARDRSWSGGSRSNFRRLSASTPKPLKEQNSANVNNTKHYDGNLQMNTPKSMRVRRSVVNGDSSTESGIQTNTRVTERRHSFGHALLSQNKKENEQRPVTAATTSSKASSTKSRRSSIPQGRFTKQELDYYLPRKSFFDCHEKKMKETEENSEDQYAKLRRRRQSAFERIHGEELKKFEGNAAITRLGVSDKLPNVKDNDNDKPEKIEINPVTLVSTLDQNTSQQQQKQQNQQQQQERPQEQQLQQQQTTKPVKKKSKKKSEDDDEINVDYSILVHYLKFIRDHPDEYIAGRNSLHQANHHGSELKLDDSIIKMAHIFERGHHGEQSDGLLVQAVHEIRPQFFENVEGSPNSEELKSEFEKHRVRVDKWIRSISTAQLNRAKELALKELGDEDQAQTKWWLALRACHYIRHPEDPNAFRNHIQ